MTRVLAGKHILIVEDEYFIANDLARALAREQAFVVGPAPDLNRGLALAESEWVDAALLDVNLSGERSFAVVDRLAERGVPFIFLTGYDGWAIPERCRDAPRISKPCPIPSVLTLVEQLLAP